MRRSMPSLLLAFTLLAPSVHAASSLYMRSDFGDYIGEGATRNLTEPTYTFQATHNAGKSITIHVSNGPTLWRFYAGSPGGLVAGPHEEASDLMSSGLPGLDVSGESRACGRSSGRLTVLEAEYGSGNTVTRFAANFQQFCEIGGPGLYGEIRYNSSIPTTAGTTPSGNLPDLFALQAQSPVRAGTIIQSNTVPIMGVGTVPVSAVGGSHTVQTAGALGSVQERQRITALLTSSSTPGGTAQMQLTVGARTVPFSVTTWQKGMVLSGFWFRSPQGEFIGNGQTRLELAPRVGVSATKNFDNGVRVAFETAGQTLWTANFAAAGEVPLTPGTYHDAMRWPFQTPSQPGLDFNGSGAGCNEVSGRFTVHEVEFGTGGEVTRFAADFEQYCEKVGPALVGEVRVNSTIPFRTLMGGAATSDYDLDGIPDAVEERESTDPLRRDNDVFASARLFALQQYRDFLAREGDAGGIDYWTGRVASGAVTRGEAIGQFLASPEFAGAIAPVARLYFAYFRRIPDQAGLDFWVDHRLAGNAMEAISNAFALSPEFVDTYGPLDNAGFVDLVYRNVLGRAPEAAGFAYWRGELDAGRLTRGQVMLAFSEAPEYTAITANEIFVVMTYLGMLQRAPEKAGYDFWVGYMDQGNSGLALIEGFLAAPEYRARFLP